MNGFESHLPCVVDRAPGRPANDIIQETPRYEVTIGLNHAGDAQWNHQLFIAGRLGVPNESNRDRFPHDVLHGISWEGDPCNLVAKYNCRGLIAREPSAGQRRELKTTGIVF